MAFDKVEIKVIMQVSTVVKSKMPVAWGWLSAYFSVRAYTCTFDSFCYDSLCFWLNLCVLIIKIL